MHFTWSFRSHDDTKWGFAFFFFNCDIFGRKVIKSSFLFCVKTERRIRKKNFHDDFLESLYLVFLAIRQNYCKKWLTIFIQSFCLDKTLLHIILIIDNLTKSWLDDKFPVINWTLIKLLNTTNDVAHVTIEQ